MVIAAEQAKVRELQKDVMGSDSRKCRPGTAHDDALHCCWQASLSWLLRKARQWQPAGQIVLQQHLPQALFCRQKSAGLLRLKCLLASCLEGSFMFIL